MGAWVALLRAVNLAGKRKVAMADLRELAGDLGLEEPKTLLMSGNLVFGSEGRDAAGLETLLRVAASERLGLDTEFFVRSAKEWREILAGNPFADEAETDPGHLLVFVMDRAADPADVDALRAAIKGREAVRPRSRHLYITYPDGIGRSKLTTALIERKLGARGTGRNWNTVVKLAAAAGARG